MTYTFLTLVRRFGLVALVLLLGSFQAFSQEFRAGAAKAKITPEELGWIGGYGHRNRPAEGVAADLWTRALVIEDSQKRRHMLVSADIHIFTVTLHRQLVEAVQKRHGIAERDLMLIANSHAQWPRSP